MSGQIGGHHARTGDIHVQRIVRLVRLPGQVSGIEQSGKFGITVHVRLYVILPGGCTAKRKRLENWAFKWLSSTPEIDLNSQRFKVGVLDLSILVENGRNVDDLGRTDLSASSHQVGQQQMTEQLRTQMVDHEVLLETGLVQFEWNAEHTGIVDQRKHIQVSALDLGGELTNRFEAVQIQLNERHLAQVLSIAAFLLDLFDRLLSFLLIAAC